MQRLTIVRAMPFYDPAIQFGGVVSQSREISRRLAERGHRVLVVTTDNGQAAEVPRDRWLDQDGYRVFYATTRPHHRVAPYWTPSIRAPLREVLPGADVLQLNVGLTLTNHIARQLARKFGVPYVYNAEGALCPVRLRIRSLSKRLFLPLVERRVLRDAAAVQALTPKDIEDVVRQGAPRQRVHLIPNGVDPVEAPCRADPVEAPGRADPVEAPGRADPVEAPGRADQVGPTGGLDLLSARQRFDIPADVPLVLFLGRIHQIKGLDLLIESIRRCSDPPPWLLIVGPDEDGSQPGLEALIDRLDLSARVRFTGALDGEAREAAFAAADVFALTSKTEGLPMGVLEACARGLPCLLTPHCNVPEVQDAGAGRIESADSKALAAALGDMLGDAKALRAMGRAARRLIDDHFSLNRVVDALEDLYRGIAGPRPTPGN